MKKKRQFCLYCGGTTIKKHEDNVRRDFCPSCNSYFYENPLPVVSTILESSRRILLVKRGRPPSKGRWCLPSGFAEAGESIEQAALRELVEETGIKGKIIKLQDVDSYKSLPSARINERWMPILKAEEISGRYLILLSNRMIKKRFRPLWRKIP